MSESNRPGESPAGPASTTLGREVALFDLDHTLTHRDTFLDFCLLNGGARCLRALPGLGAACLEGDDVARNTALKRAVTRALFRGWPVQRMQEAGLSYATGRLPRLLRPEAIARIQWHTTRGHRVVVVSASLEYWIAPWCRSTGLELIATGLQVREGTVTGELDPPNCYGPEKARRVRAWLGQAPARPVVHAYGDSKGDRQMLELADFPYYRSFARPIPAPGAGPGETMNRSNS